MSTIEYHPTEKGVTPTPRLLRHEPIGSQWVGRWVPVTEALPPQRFGVLVIVRDDDCPAYAWLKYAAGDKACPFFVCPQIAAIAPRGLKEKAKDITYWFAPTSVGLPYAPEGGQDSEWGLQSNGWYRLKPKNNQKGDDDGENTDE